MAIFTVFFFPQRFNKNEKTILNHFSYPFHPSYTVIYNRNNTFRRRRLVVPGAFGASDNLAPPPVHLRVTLILMRKNSLRAMQKKIEKDNQLIE